MFPIRACRDRCPHRPALPVYTAPLVGADGSVRPICAPILFFLFRRKKRTAAASEEASSIPFPPGRRKLHIRSLLLPFQIVTVSLGHNLAIWNFTTPHAILMMAGRRLLSDTVKTETFLRRKSRARLWSMESPENHPKGSLVVSFLFFTGRGSSFLSPKRERKEWGRKNMGDQWSSLNI